MAIYCACALRVFILYSIQIDIDDIRKEEK